VGVRGVVDGVLVGIQVWLDGDLWKISKFSVRRIGLNGCGIKSYSLLHPYMAIFLIGTGYRSRSDGVVAMNIYSQDLVELIFT
jgi:hypothetical protein